MAGSNTSLGHGCMYWLLCPKMADCHFIVRTHRIHHGSTILISMRNKANPQLALRRMSFCQGMELASRRLAE